MKFALQDLNLFPVLLSVTKKDDEKDNLECTLYIHIVQQLGQNNFENYSFMLTKFDRYFV